MSAVRPQLPQEILEPVMNRFDPTQLPIVSLALTSRTLSTPQLTQLADQTIGGELRSIAGVAQVTIVGGDSAQLNINVRPSDLAAAGVGIDQVVNTIRAQNLAAPVGRVNAALENRVIRLDGRLGAPSDFADIASRTSCIAWSMSLEKTNCTTTCPKPSVDVEFIRSTPLMDDSLSSMRVTTSRSTTSGAAPG